MSGFDLVTTGHETVMAKTTFFSSCEDSVSSSDINIFSQEFLYQEFLVDVGSIDSHFQACSGIKNFALLEFERPIVCPLQSKVIGSRLDGDVLLSNKCRISFHGNILESFTKRDYESSILPKIRIFKRKQRKGLVDRVRLV